MRLAITHLAPRRRGGSQADQLTDLAHVFGSDHPLVGAQRAVALVRNQAITAVAIALASPILALFDMRLAIVVAASAVLVAAASCGVVGALRSVRRHRVHDLILQGAPPPLPIIRSEIRRLRDPAYHADLARSLNCALHQGEQWHTYMPASRPPLSMRRLPEHRRLIQEITTELAAERVSPRAVVLLDRLMQGGYGAGIDDGGSEWLKRELGRIRFELGTTQPAEPGARGECLVEELLRPPIVMFRRR